MRRGLATIVLVIAALAAAAPAGAVSADPGDVIVGDSSRGKVFVLDPTTGQRKVLSADPRMRAPNDSAFSPDGKTLYVSDYEAFGDEGGVFEINPRTGSTEVLAKKDGFVQPDGIAVAPNGKIYVTDLSAGTEDGALFRVNPNNGSVHLVFSEATLTSPVGVIVKPNGTPIVSSSDVARIAAVDTQDGSLTTIADAGDGLTSTAGITRAPDGTIYTSNTTGDVEAVDPATGTVDDVGDGFFTGGYGLGIDLRGRLLGSNANLVVRFDPATGNVKTIGEGFDYAEGAEVVPR